MRICARVRLEMQDRGPQKVAVDAYVGSKRVGAILGNYESAAGGIREPSEAVALVVKSVRVDESVRRCGVGTMLYQRLADAGCKHDLPLQSDTLLSRAAESFWKKQVRKGRARFDRERYWMIDACPRTLRGSRR